MEQEYTVTPLIGVEVGCVKLCDLVDGYASWLNRNSISEKTSFGSVISWLEARPEIFRLRWDNGFPLVYGLRKIDTDIDGEFENLAIS